MQELTWKSLFNIGILAYAYRLHRDHLRFQLNIIVKYWLAENSDLQETSILKLLSPSINISSKRDWNESTVLPRILAFLPNEALIQDGSRFGALVYSLLKGNIKYWQTIFTTLENILIPELALNNYYLYVSKVLQNKHYKLLVVTQSVHGLERFLLDNLSFDKSLEILHGIPSGTIEVGSTDLIIANGLHDKQKLIHSGIESNKVLELGVSKYDYLINMDRHYFSIDGEVLLLDPADGYFDKFVSVHKKLLSWYKNNYGSTLYVKPHPRQKKNEIDLIIRVAKDIDLEVIVYNQSIEDTIRNFRGAIVINSTAGVEFGFTGKKLIVPYFLGETYINYEHLPCCELWLKPDHSVLNKGDMKNFYFNNCGRNKEYWKYVIS